MHDPSPNELRAAVDAAKRCGWDRDDITLAGWITSVAKRKVAEQLPAESSVVESTGRPPVGLPDEPFTSLRLAALLDHVAELQANLPLEWMTWERMRLHGWARWVRTMAHGAQWIARREMGRHEMDPAEPAAPEAESEPLRLTLALTTDDAPTAPEPPRLHPDSALWSAPAALWRNAWRAGWVAGWVVGREGKLVEGRRRGPLQPSDAGR